MSPHSRHNAKSNMTEGTKKALAVAAALVALAAQVPQAGFAASAGLLQGALPSFGIC